MKEGLIPAILGTAVAASGAAMAKRYPKASAGVMGFGLAHMLLGTIDLIEHRRGY